MTAASILWRRLDRPGHEFACLSFAGSTWHLDGMAVFAHEGRPCGLHYAIVCDAQWQTVAARVTGRVGGEAVDIEIAVDAARRWSIGGRECAGVAGCLDLDLNFSPATNLLPVRRLALSVDAAAPVRAALLQRRSLLSVSPLNRRRTRRWSLPTSGSHSDRCPASRW